MATVTAMGSIVTWLWLRILADPILIKLLNNLNKNLNYHKFLNLNCSDIGGTLPLLFHHHLRGFPNRGGNKSLEFALSIQICLKISGLPPYSYSGDGMFRPSILLEERVWILRVSPSNKKNQPISAMPNVLSGKMCSWATKSWPSCLAPTSSFA